MHPSDFTKIQVLLKETLLGVFLIFTTLGAARAQEVDHSAFNSKQLLLPGVLITYGVLSFTVDGVRNWDYSIQNKIQGQNYSRTHLDDYLQYVPGVSVYALNVCGLKGKHNLKDYTTILASTYLMVGAFSLPIKFLTHRERPDGSNFQSFPSGHTTMAFANAELLRTEYKNVSIWYGVAGYTVATATGALRMYNNKHWLSDVVAGAGFGILSARVAYWSFPYINKLIFKEKKSNSTGLFLPFYNGEQLGASIAIRL